MTHLSHAELIDCAEDALASGRAAHLRSCAVCAAAAAELRATLRAAMQTRTDVPEPPPDFWRALTSTVADAVSAAPVPRRWPSLALRTFAPLAAAAIVVAALWLPARMRPAERAMPPASDGRVGAAANAAADHDSLEPVDAHAVEAWNVLTAVAADLEWDAAHAAGMSVQPSAVDRAVQRLTPDELNELGRLLQSELRRAGN